MKPDIILTQDMEKGPSCSCVSPGSALVALTFFLLHKAKGGDFLPYILVFLNPMKPYPHSEANSAVSFTLG